MKRSELSQITGIGESTLRLMEKKDWNPTLQVLRKLEKGRK